MDNSTCWILIHGAAEGKAGDRETFARLYAPVLRGYLGSRWRGSHLAGEVEDAVQEVFVECFRAGGVLDRVDPDRPGGFRAFLYGVARNVALRWERRAGRRGGHERVGGPDPDEVPRDEATLSRAFDRAWTEALLIEAGRLQERRAGEAGEEALRRVELLRLRFQEDLPIREIARRWDTDPERLHKEYARARQEFRAALLDVVSFHHPGTAAEVERVAAELLGLL